MRTLWLFDNVCQFIRKQIQTTKSHRNEILFFIRTYIANHSSNFVTCNKCFSYAQYITEPIILHKFYRQKRNRRRFYIVIVLSQYYNIFPFIIINESSTKPCQHIQFLFDIVVQASRMGWREKNIWTNGSVMNWSCSS